MKKVFDIIEMTIQVISRIFIGGIVAVIFYAVVMRYIFHRPPAWSEELSRFTFIWMIMLGAVLVTREQSHIQITFVLDLLPKKLRFFLSNFVRLLMLAFCWVMIQEGLEIYPIVAEASSPSFGISMGWLYLSIPVGGILMGIYILETIVKSIVDRVKAASFKE
ncbi:MAG: TRAP transporter small permease [Dehalococcoidia bacterium]|nr:TRAP transporter small permease [Dehalococcoidia bacterium]